MRGRLPRDSSDWILGGVIGYCALTCLVPVLISLGLMAYALAVSAGLILFGMGSAIAIALFGVGSVAYLMVAPFAVSPPAILAALGACALVTAVAARRRRPVRGA